MTTQYLNWVILHHIATRLLTEPKHYVQHVTPCLLERYDKPLAATRYIGWPASTCCSTQTTMFSKTSFALLVAFVTVILRLLFKRRSLRFLKGPPSPSFLTGRLQPLSFGFPLIIFIEGNENEMRYQEQVGDLEFQWVKEYGTAYRIAGCLGVNFVPNCSSFY